MNATYLLDWARRAANDLREYADAADQAGTPQMQTKALLAELDDILDGRPIWRHRAARLRLLLYSISPTITALCGPACRVVWGLGANYPRLPD